MDYPKRKHPRLKDYDYSKCGAYFITICAENKANIFSHIVPPRDTGCSSLDVPHVKLTPIGKIVDSYINQISVHYENISVDSYVIMPNHVHLLLTFTEFGAPRFHTVCASRPTANLSSVVAALKRFSNRDAGKNLWQTGFYDHIIRDETDYLTRLQYIDHNPAKWFYNLK